MKKLYIIVGLVIIGFSSYLFVNSVNPVSEVKGCYTSEKEKLCLLNDDVYKQYNLNGVVNNEGNWRQFKYNTPEGESTGVVISRYKIPCNKDCGQGSFIKEVDIQPQYNILKGTYFYIRSVPIGKGDRDYYSKN